MEPNLIVVKIKTLDNALHEVKISREASIENLKIEILNVDSIIYTGVTFLLYFFQKLNIPLDKQRLIFQGKLLLNHELLSQLKVKLKFG